jgi:hypothetical protein
MTTQEIKRAVDQGKTVHWKNSLYTVIKAAILYEYSGVMPLRRKLILKICKLIPIPYVAIQEKTKNNFGQRVP